MPVSANPCYLQTFFPVYSDFDEGFNCPLPYANYVTFTCRKVDRETNWLILISLATQHKGLAWSPLQKRKALSLHTSTSCSYRPIKLPFRLKPQMSSTVRLVLPGHFGTSSPPLQHWPRFATTFPASEATSPMSLRLGFVLNISTWHLRDKHCNCRSVPCFGSCCGSVRIGSCWSYGSDLLRFMSVRFVRFDWVRGDAESLV